jgi:hypothetical protein
LSHAFFVVALGNLQTLHPLPELKRRVVIVDRKISSNDFATHLCVTSLETIAVMSSEVETSREVTCNLSLQHSSTPLGMTVMKGQKRLGGNQCAFGIRHNYEM